MSDAHYYRKFRKTVVFAVCGLLALPVICEAQTSPSGEASSYGNKWSDITEVVVHAKLPGPPMWKLQKGDATVWVLPILNLTPTDLAWDSRRFSRILKSADALYIPDPKGHELEKSIKFKIPINRKLSDYVSKSTYKRVIETIDQQNLSHSLILQTKPAYLGPSIYNLSLFQHRLLGWLDLVQIDQAFYKPRAKVVAFPWYGTKVSLDLWASESDEQAENCLNLFLDGVDYELPMAPEIAKAWAQGDLNTILEDYRESPWISCIESQPKFADEYRRIVDDPIIDQINDLLDAGTGTTVMLLPLSDVLKKGGILDQLREDGVEITSPPQ